MSQSSTLQAVVLVRREVGEADRLIRLFSREQGGLWVRAKGLRRAGAKLAGSLEPLSTIRVECVVGRSISVVTGARILESFQGILHDYDALVCAQSLLELTDRCFVDGSPEPSWYDWLIDALRGLDHPASSSYIRRIWVASLAHHLVLAGLSPEFPASSVDLRLSISGGRFGLEGGELVSASARKLWRVCASAPLEQILRITGADEAFMELKPILQHFWHYQTGISRLRSQTLS